MFSFKNVFQKVLPVIITSILFTSCYSVRVVSRDGVPQPDPLNQSNDFYKNKNVTVVDTTVTLKLTDGEFFLIEKCTDGGFYSFEYRVTFGGLLLNAITFGRKKVIRLKYVCIKPD